jgi:hypothetical protein
MLKLSCSYDSVRFILLKIGTEWVINCYILCHFSIPNHVVTIVGAGAASGYGSGSDQMIRLRNTGYEATPSGGARAVKQCGAGADSSSFVTYV